MSELCDRLVEIEKAILQGRWDDSEAEALDAEWLIAEVKRARSVAAVLVYAYDGDSRPPTKAVSQARRWQT